MSNVMSSVDLQDRYSAISALCHKSREPIFIMHDGKEDLAVMSMEVYESMAKNHSAVHGDSKEELYRLLAEGRADVAAGRTRPHAEVMADMRQRILDGKI